MVSTEWTWIVYIATHNNVAPYGQQSVDAMRQAAPDERVRVLVQQDTPTGCVRRVIGSTPEIVAEMGEADSGDPATLLDCIRWAAATAPARRYALVLWSHGTGWQPKDMERLAQQQPAAVPVTRDELERRNTNDDSAPVFFSSSLRRLLAEPTPGERDIAFDNGSGHSLDTIELGQVMRQARALLGQPIDLVAMNACQMSSVEVAYQLRDDVRVYVASEENMPVASLPYDTILSQLAAQPTMDAADLGRMLVKRYCARYRDDTQLPWGSGAFPPGVTLAALDLARCDRLATAVRRLSESIRAGMADQVDAVFAAYRKTYAFRSFHLCDLASFCRALIAAQPTSDTVAAATVLVATLTDSTLLLAFEHTAPVYNACAGLTTYFPRIGAPLSPYYAETDYAQATGWGEFMQSYHTA